jgi:hypothetical protein
LPQIPTIYYQNPFFSYCLSWLKEVKFEISLRKKVLIKKVGAVEMYKAILFLFFIVVCMTAVIFTSLKDNVYSFL